MRTSSTSLHLLLIAGLIGPACADDGLEGPVAGSSSAGDLPTGGGAGTTGGTTGGTGGDPGTAGEATGGTTGGTAGADTSGGSATGGPPSSQTAEEFYMSTCSACHGATGEGVAQLGPELRHPVRDYSAFVIRNGRLPAAHADFPGSLMLSYSTDVLDDAKLSAVLDFLDTFPQPTDGQGLYLDYCATCHGAAGEGPAPMNRPIAEEDAAEFISNVRSGHHPGEFDNRGEYMPVWDETQLTDAELTAMAQFIAGG